MATNSPPDLGQFFGERLGAPDPVKPLEQPSLDSFFGEKRPQYTEGDDDWAITKGFKSGVEGVKSMGGMFAALAGEALDNDTIKNWGLELYKDSGNMAAQINETVTSSYADVEGFGDAVEYLAYGIGNVAAQFAPTIAAGGVGGMAGRYGFKKIATDLLERELAKDKTLAEALDVVDARRKTLETIGAGAGGYGAGGVLVTGEYGGEIFEETGELRPEVAGAFGVAGGALEAFAPLKILDKAGLSVKFLEDFGKTKAGSVLFGAGVEGATEMAQTVLGRYAVQWADENAELFPEGFKEELINAGLLGSLGGGVISGAGAVFEGAVEPTGDDLEREARGMELERQRRLGAQQDAAAERAAAEARARGGDDLDASIAAAMTYMEGEPTALNLGTPFGSTIQGDLNAPMPTDPTTAQGTINLGPGYINPYDQGASSYEIDGGMIPFEGPNFPPDDGGDGGGGIPEILMDFTPAENALGLDLERRLGGGRTPPSLEERLLDPGTEPPVPEGFDDLPGAEPIQAEIDRAGVADLEAERDEIDRQLNELPPRPKQGDPPNAEMELLEAISAYGGLNMDEAEAQGIDPEALNTRRLGIQRVFGRKNAKTYDEMAELLREQGFDIPDANALVEMVSRGINQGETTYSQNARAVIDREMGEANREDIQRAIDQYDANLIADGEDPPPALLDRMDDPIVQLGYDLEEANALGIPDSEIDSILDTQEVPDIARQKIRELINARKSEAGSTSRAAGDQEAPQQAAPTEGDEGPQPGKLKADQLGLFDPPAPKDRKPSEPQPEPRPAGDLFGEPPTREQRTQAAIRRREEQDDMFGAETVVTGEQDPRQAPAEPERPADVPADIDGGLFATGQQVDITDQPLTDEPGATDDEFGPDLARTQDTDRTVPVGKDSIPVRDVAELSPVEARNAISEMEQAGAMRGLSDFLNNAAFKYRQGESMDVEPRARARADLEKVFAEYGLPKRAVDPDTAEALANIIDRGYFFRYNDAQLLEQAKREPRLATLLYEAASGLAPEGKKSGLSDSTPEKNLGYVSPVLRKSIPEEAADYFNQLIERTATEDPTTIADGEVTEEDVDRFFEQAIAENYDTLKELVDQDASRKALLDALGSGGWFPGGNWQAGDFAGRAKLKLRKRAGRGEKLLGFMEAADRIRERVKSGDRPTAAEVKDLEWQAIEDGYRTPDRRFRIFKTEEILKRGGKPVKIWKLIDDTVPFNYDLDGEYWFNTLKRAKRLAAELVANEAAVGTAVETKMDADDLRAELLDRAENHPAIQKITYQRDNVIEAIKRAPDNELQDYAKELNNLIEREEMRNAKGEVNRGIPYQGPTINMYDVDDSGHTKKAAVNPLDPEIRPESGAEKWEESTYIVDELFRDNKISINLVKKKDLPDPKTLAEAEAQIDEWEQHALGQQRMTAMDGKPNYERAVVSLFDLSGNWARPYVQAGYEVITVDIQAGVDMEDLSPEFMFDHLYNLGEIYAVLAAPPCTIFTQANTRNWKEGDKNGRTQAAVDMVGAVLGFIEWAKPQIWAIENPQNSRMGTTVGGNSNNNVTGLPQPRLNFSHNDYGDPYSKPTSLWGNFNPNLPRNYVEATGSFTDQAGGSSQATMNKRSETPEGFAYSFFMANNFIDNQTSDYALQQLKDTFPFATGAVEQAFNAGVPVETIYKVGRELHEWEDNNSEFASELYRIATEGSGAIEARNRQWDEKTADGYLEGMATKANNAKKDSPEHYETLADTGLEEARSLTDVRDFYKAVRSVLEMSAAEGFSMQDVMRLYESGGAYQAQSAIAQGLNRWFTGSYDGGTMTAPKELRDLYNSVTGVGLADATPVGVATNGLARKVLEYFGADYNAAPRRVEQGAVGIQEGSKDALKAKVYVEEAEGPNGEIVEIRETALDRVRDYDRRCKKLDKLLGCVLA